MVMKPQRVSFAQQSGWGWSSLRARIEAVRWLQADADEAAAAAVRQIFERGARSVERWADAHGVALPRAVRNLVAEAPGEDLPLWRLLLSSDNWPVELAQDLTTVLAALPVTPGPRTRLIGALLDGGPVTTAGLVALLGSQSPRPFERSLGRRLRKRHAPTASGLVRMIYEGAHSQGTRYKLQLIKRAIYYRAPSEPLTLDDCIAMPMGWIDDLLRWPHLIRMLEAGEVERIGDNDEKYRTAVTGLAADLAAWRARRRSDVLAAVVEALRARDFEAAALVEFAGDARQARLSEAAAGRITSALAAETTFQVPERTFPALDGFLRPLPPGLRSLARFILSDAAARVGMLAATTGAGRSRVIRSAHTNELVATILSPDLERSQIRLLITYVCAAGKASSVLAALLGTQDPPSTDHARPAVPDEMFADWLQVGTVPASKRRDVLARGLRYVTPSHRALVALASEHLETLPRAPLLELLLDRERSGAWRHVDPARWRRLYLRLTRLIMTMGWLEPTPSAVAEPTLLDAAMRSFPDLAVPELARTDSLLDPEVAQRLPRDPLEAWLTALPDARRFADLLRKARRLGVALPAAVLEIGLSHPDSLRILLTKAPDAVPLERILGGALYSRELAEVVEGIYPPSARWPLLGWVREQYADRPGHAVANEIATAFGLTYAGYLRHLARLVEIPADPAARGRQFDALYRSYQLPKRTGGNRTITVPERALRGLQRTILSDGFDAVSLHPAATGFRKGLSIRENAFPHVGKPIVVNIDIESCFPSTRYELIHRACRQLCDGQLSPGATRLVADICSYGGGLPVGAPTSPAIANIVLRSVDRALAMAALRKGITYTRYADDLTFSGDEHALKLIPFASRLLRELGYRIDRRKTNIYRRGRRQLVTGLVVNERADLPRRTRRRLRAALHRRESGRQPEWHGAAIDDQALLGWFAYLAMLRPTDGADGRKRIRAAARRAR